MKKILLKVTTALYVKKMLGKFVTHVGAKQLHVLYVEQSINPISPHNVIVEIPTTQIPQSQHRNTNVIRAGSYCKEICGCFIFCVQRIALFFLVVYLGKFYIYAYCAGTCDTDNRYIKDKDTDEITDKCTCYDYVNIDNYWTRFDRIFVELLIGLIINAVLFGCCAKQQ